MFASRKKRKGMTMIEMMGVAVLLAVFAGMVGMAIFNNIKQGKVSAAQSQIRQMGQALETLNAMTAGADFPDQSSWFNYLVSNGAITDPRNAGPVDPWGQQYQYCQATRQSPGRNGYIWSKGPSGNGPDQSQVCSNSDPLNLLTNQSNDTGKYNLYYEIKVVN